VNSAEVAHFAAPISAVGTSVTALSWADLVTAAVLGTQRHALSSAEVIDPSELLDAIAGRVAMRRAGRLPDPPVSREPAPCDDRSDAPSAAIALLGELIEVGPNELVVLWLQRAAAHSMRPPAEHMVALATSPAVQPHLDPVDLPRLDWLSEQLPELRLRHRRVARSPVALLNAPVFDGDAATDLDRDATPQHFLVGGLTQLTLRSAFQSIADASAAQLVDIAHHLVHTSWSAAQLRLADQLAEAVARRHRLDAHLPPPLDV
jgi:hypothetical protein